MIHSDTNRPPTTEEIFTFLDCPDNFPNSLTSADGTQIGAETPRESALVRHRSAKEEREKMINYLRLRPKYAKLYRVMERYVCSFLEE